MKNLNTQEQILHQKFTQLGKEHKLSKNRLLRLIPEINKTGLALKLGFSDIFEYAIKVAGLSHSSVKLALRIGKRLEQMPTLKQSIEKVGINKVEIVARVATPETEAFWVDKVENMSKNALTIAVKETKHKSKTGITTPFAAPEKVKVELSHEAQKSFNRLKKQMQLNENCTAIEMMLKKLEELMNESNSKIVLNQSKNQTYKIQNSKKVIKQTILITKNATGRVFQNSKSTTGRKFETQKSKTDKVKSKHQTHESDVRYVIAAIRKEVKNRSQSICEYKNCTKTADHIHHIIPFAISRSNDPSNLIALCKGHHEIMHNGFSEQLSYIDKKFRENRVLKI